ncbi:MAG: BamA/TamA family outer membrane protein [Gammaproteobacteria bacterium]|nr:BamA/TamA family outer membrane protein [Gammaproteobacteria bacterium]
MRIHRLFFSGIIILIMFAWPLLVSGQMLAVSADAAEGQLVGHIVIQGLERTNSVVVERELLISSGKPLELQALQESVQRLKNLRIFNVVNARLVRNPKAADGEIIVIFELQEVWTTVPILKINQGGDTTYVVAGVFDINIGGNYVEAGAQYESWNGEPGGVIWFRDPYFMNSRFRLGGDIWAVKRPRDLYEADGSEQGRFVLYRRRANLFFDRELSNQLTLGLGLAFNKDSFLNSELTSGRLSDATVLQLQDKGASRSVLARAFFRVGRLDYDNYLLRGAVSELTLAQAVPALGSDDEFYRAEWDSQAFWRLSHEANLAARLRLGASNSDDLQHLFYVGGFEHVRGYLDGQLRGSRYWQANLEYRIAGFKRPWVVLQSTVFFDMAQVNSTTSDTGVGSGDTFYSTGVGFRIISPKIHRFIGRFDFALNTSHPATSRFSFGVQQFF